MDRRKTEHTHYSLVALICVLIVTFALGMSGVAAAGQNSTNLDVVSGFTKVGNFDMNALRQQYFSQTAVQETTASYSGKRWVIVELEGDSLFTSYENDGYAYGDFTTYCNSTEAQSIKANIEAAHRDFLSLLDENNFDYAYKYSYSTLNNGVALKVDADTFNAIKQLDGVKSVYYSESYSVPTVAVTNNANVYTTGIYDSSNLDYKGEGMVVAILDTGLDYSHEAFATMPTNPAWNKEYVAEKMAASTRFNAQATIDDVYYNAKVPYAYDYADDDSDVYPSYSTHGTHVAGIVAGKSDYVVNKETDERFVGVAPEAQLVICKVFTDNLDSDSLGGADTIDIIAAVSDCVELGVDVINMSLGSSAGFSDEKSDELINEVYNRVRAAGISLVVAASNDYSSGFGGGNGTNLASNPDSGTVGSPSTYGAALSVASINGQKATFVQANDDENQVAFITESSDANGNEYDFVDRLYTIAGKSKGKTLNYKYVVVGGVGRATNYTAKIRKELQDKDGYDGTIALIKRGDNTFAEKVQNAMDNGADAVIIYNNLSGTIRMSLGDVNDPVPTCSIPMDAGKVFVENADRGVGSIQINSEFKAGPFMSDFSSWGPTPDLQLKPEITAHGGEITSAVPGGYDVYSGTSMAAPNMSGAVALLRQYLKTANPTLTGTELNARVNQVLMSTATIALNDEGNPYSPRKQGAGLAGIADAISAESFITVKDKDGNVRDKTKIELYDDKTKTGVYEFEFIVNNISGRAEEYAPTVYVMTETLASDNKTVAEKAYMLSDSTIEYFVDGASHTGNITVGANATTTVKVRITLSAAAREYLDKSFENGMYVEGFVSLKGVDATKVTIGLPYLAFYGDWTDAPLFDYSTYDLAESQKDTNVPAEDKLVASAADTKVIGMYFDDKYILQLGAYLYEMEESDVKIYPEKEKAAVSMFDNRGQRTIYEVYMVYAGLLRGAAYMNVEIKDAATGQVVYTERQENISKSYAAGGSNRAAAITLEIKPSEWNLLNNGTYYVSLKGELDYPGGENPKRNSFDFRFTVDYEAPQMLDYRIRYESYTENKKTKYRIYMDVDVIDNQFVQDVMPCYVKSEKGTNTLTLLTKHPIPVYGGQGQKSTVSFDITDIYEDYIKTGKMYIAVEDYAMNQSTYVINAKAGLDYPESVTIGDPDGRLVNTEEEGEYPVYDLEIKQNELFTPTIATLPDASMSQTLSWYVAKGSSVVAVNNEEIFGLTQGKATVYLKDGEDADSVTYARVDVVVTEERLAEPVADKIVFPTILNGSGYAVNADKNDLDLNPGQTLQIVASMSPWYIQNVEFTWSSTNPAVVEIDDLGNVTAKAKGTAYIEAKANGTRLSKKLKIVVGDYYRIINYTLYDYYGGEECVIPEDKNVMYIDEECFWYNTNLKRVVLPSTLTEIPKTAFKGCTNLEEVVIPSQCIVIGESAFEGCTKLKTVKFGMFTDRDHNVSDTYHGAITLGRRAFAKCTSLTTIENPQRITTAGDGAFSECTALASIDISELRVTGSEVFSNCTKLANVTTSKYTNIGTNMFAGCTALKSFVFKGSYLKEGAFNGCSALTSFTFEPEDEFLGIGNYALAGVKISTITLPNGTYSIGESAFEGCSSLKEVVLSSDTVLIGGQSTPFANCEKFGKFSINGESAKYSIGDGLTVKDAGVLYNKNKTQILSVPTAKTDFELLSSVASIADGAFAGSKAISTFDLSGVSEIGKYAFAGSTIKTVTFGSIAALPEGVFANCSKLTDVNGIGGVLRVGAYAFKGTTALRSVTLASATSIGDYAFQNSGVTEVVAANVESIGKGAFASSKLSVANFEKATSIGDRAFAVCNNLTSAKFGGVSEMGKEVFVSSSALTNVTFGRGTKVIGAYAFYSSSARENLISVAIPDGIENVGEFAFYNCTGLSTINVTGAKTIENYAFYNCTSLSEAALGTVETIGKGAFANTALKRADLTAAVEIDAYAFMSTPLESVNFGAARFIGDYAFANTALTMVTLPVSFNKSTYEYTWMIYDEKGRVEKVKTRNIPSFGAGAFSSIPTLTAINVAGDGEIVSIDGILYAIKPDGYELLQYPAGKSGKSFKTIDGTVAIGDSAFEGVETLENIELVYTVGTIGSYAFYSSSVKNYTFNSVEAPTLIAKYVDTSGMQTSDVVYLLFAQSTTSTSAIGSTIYYANFFDYVSKRIYRDYFDKKFYDAPDFKLTMTVPKNGKGYDTNVWTEFFSTIEKTDTILPDATTHEAIDAIDKIASAMSNDEIASASSIEALQAVAKATQDARKAYNAINDKEQIALIGEKEQILLAAEKALREAKARLGQPVALVEVKIATIPNKIRYVEGETFDPTGMVVKAIFADGSEIAVTDYTLDKTTFAFGDEKVVVTYVYDGQTYSVDLLVNVEQKTAPVNPDTPSDDKDEKEDKGEPKDKTMIIVVSVVVPVVVIAGIVAAVLVVLKKKKSATKVENNEKEDDSDDFDEK